MTIPGPPEGHLSSHEGNVEPTDHYEPPTGRLPVVIAADSRASDAPPSTRRLTPILLTVIGVLVVALGVMAALWVSTSNHLSAIESARVPRSDLIEIAEPHLGETAFVTGDSDAVNMVILDSGVAKAQPGLSKMLDAIGFSLAILDRMGHTRALDGTREAQGHNCNVTWTYHPDHGPQMIFEAVQPG